MNKNEIIELIGNNLRQLINKKNITVNELARKSNVSAGTISKIMNGNMSVTIPMVMTIANGLEVDATEILKGLIKSPELLHEQPTTYDEPDLKIGILSINNRRITCIKDKVGSTIGFSELEHGLDLAESSSLLMQLIQESIEAALSNNIEFKGIDLKKSDINLVMQSYEFEDTRSKFNNFLLRRFNNAVILSDWQLTHICNFENNDGISLIIDKGVSFSYKKNNMIKKIGGWKFPVYDFGGENWLGAETIHHTIEAFEGFRPMSELARAVLAKFGGTINAITELCFKGTKNPDVYCLFYEVLINRYLTGDQDAEKIIDKGKYHIKKLLVRADEITGENLKIALQGSMRDIYKSLIPEERLVGFKENDYKASYLSSLNSKLLLEYGITV